MAEDKKKWSKDIKLKEGSLEKLGWPNVGSLVANVRSGKVSYKTMIAKLNYLANVNKDPATKAKARGAIARLQKAFPEGGSKKK